MYTYSDAVFLYGMLRHARPKRIVEVGSGFSSAAMLDTIDQHLDGDVACTFIEPYPERLRVAAAARGPRARHHPRAARPGRRLEPFLALEQDDILFIDSSHAVKIGSDVNHLLGEVLPRLRVGVYVHVHDIFYPFEYPRSGPRRAGRGTRPTR